VRRKKVMSNRASSKHILVFVLLFALGSASVALAQSTSEITFDKQEDVIQQIDIIANDAQSSPSDLLKEIDRLIALSKKNEWPEAVAESLVIKTEFLVNLGEFEQSAAQLLVVEAALKQHSTKQLNVRVRLLQLAIADSLGAPEQNGEMRQALLDLAPSIEDFDFKASIFIGVAQSQLDANNLVDAIQNLKQANRYFENTDNVNGVGSVLSTLGNVYLDLGNAKTALEYFQQAIKKVRLVANRFDESVLLYNIGNAYYSLRQFDDSLDYLKQAQALSLELNDIIGVAWVQHLLGKIYLDQERWQDSLEQFTKAYTKFTEVGLNDMHFQAILGATEALLELGRLSEADANIRIAEQHLQKTQANRYRLSFYEMKAKLAFKEGSFEQSSLMFESALNVYKEIAKEERERQTQRYAIEFETESKEQQNQLLSRENEINLQLLQKQKQLQMVWVALTIVGLLLFILLILILLKQVRKRNVYRDMAHKDPLTLAPNRRAILNFANWAFKSASSGKFCIAIIDIDDFKALNDEYGHDMGDEVLIAFARACEVAIRDNDGYGRYGGEEWLLCFSNIDTKNIQDVFERINYSLKQNLPQALLGDKNVTFSMGVAVYKAGNDNKLNAMIARADKMLYQAKASGKNKVILDEDQDTKS